MIGHEWLWDPLTRKKLINLIKSLMSPLRRFKWALIVSWSFIPLMSTTNHAIMRAWELLLSITSAYEWQSEVMAEMLKCMIAITYNNVAITHCSVYNAKGTSDFSINPIRSYFYISAEWCSYIVAVWAIMKLQALCDTFDIFHTMYTQELVSRQPIIAIHIFHESPNLL